MSRIATYFLLLFFTVSIAAQQRIARIEVRGDVPASIVLSQSALVEGRAYTESDLDAAVARIRRLPFVHDARYVVDGETLRIEVTGMTPLFGEVEVLGAKTDFDDVTGTTVGAGGRHFLGSGGVVEANVSTMLGEGEDLTRGTLQYSHYGIGGTRLFAIAGLGINLNDSRHFESDPTWQLLLGYPLTARQTITASVLRTGYESSRSSFIETDAEMTELELLWTYDTTEDPFFARRGTKVSAGPSWTELDSTFDEGAILMPPLDVIGYGSRTNAETAAVSVEARTFHPIRTRSTLFAGLDANIGQTDYEQRIEGSPTLFSNVDRRLYRVSAGFGHNFFDWSSPVKDGRHRIEIALAATRERYYDGLFRDQNDEVSLSAGYVFRKRFGTVRVNLIYVRD